MALLPYSLLDDLRSAFDPEDCLSDVFNPAITIRHYMRPWRNLAAAARDIGSTIKTDKDKFQVNLDVQHFDPEDISVKTSDGYIVIEAKHEERKDEHGFISRQFRRRYNLPEGCNPDTVESRLSSDGVLTVTAPRVTGGDERPIPIAHTGPIRRKIQDWVNEADADADEDKSPQKKSKKQRRQ